MNYDLEYQLEEMKRRIKKGYASLEETCKGCHHQISGISDEGFETSLIVLTYPIEKKILAFDEVAPRITENIKLYVCCIVCYETVMRL